MKIKTATKSGIRSALAKGGQYLNRARQWVTVKAGEHINPDDVVLAMISPDSAAVSAAVKMAKRVVRKVKKNPTATGAAAVAERGPWSVVKPEKRSKSGGVFAWGPTGTLEDAEGRLYPFRWALLPFSRLITSHNPRTWQAERFYPKQLQGRNRESLSSRSQVQTLAAGLDPRRLLLASSTPADSAPVVWRGTGEHSEVFMVISGNGRAMAANLAFSTESEAWEQYLSAVLARWNIASKIDDLARDDRFLAVRVLGGKDGASIEQAVALAGASQGTASAGLSDLEKAVHLGRSLEIETPMALGRFRFPKPVKPETVSEWIADNSATWRNVLGRMDASKAAAIGGDPSQASALVEAVMLQGVPRDVVARAYSAQGKPDLVPVLLGMLPAVWTLESAAVSNPPEISEGWRLLPRLSIAFEWLRRLDGKSLAKMQNALKEEQEQRGFDFGEKVEGPKLEDPLAFALGVAMVKASARVSPSDAISEYLRGYVAEAFQTGTGESMFGEAMAAQPGAVLLAHVDRRFLNRRRNPPRGTVKHGKSSTSVVYPGGVVVRFRRRVEDPEAVALADAHYLEALEGQQSIFSEMQRETELVKN